MSRRTHEPYANSFLFNLGRRRPGTHDGPRDSTRRLCDAAFAGVLVVTVILALVPGCASTDTRISLDELNRLETEISQVEPVALEIADLALTELRPYRVGPNDILDITLTGLGDQYAQTMLSLRVDDDGTIMLPMVGRVEVAGLDLKGVDKALYNAHVPQRVKDMSVFVQLGGPEETTVVVIGAAGESGLVKLPRNERSVLYALARAVGFGPAGSGRVHIHPVRPERPKLTFDLTDINDLRRALLAPPLESGDMVVVEPAEASVVYVTGLVNAPGPVPLPQHGSLSLVRAVATVYYGHARCFGGESRRAFDRMAHHNNVGVLLSHFNRVPERLALLQRRVAGLGKAYDLTAEPGHGALEAESRPCRWLEKKRCHHPPLHKRGIRPAFQLFGRLQNVENLVFRKVLYRNYIPVSELHLNLYCIAQAFYKDFEKAFKLVRVK